MRSMPPTRPFRVGGDPAAVKAALLLKAAEIVKRRSDEIADKLARETGSTLPFSRFQQGLVAERCSRPLAGSTAQG